MALKINEIPPEGLTLDFVQEYILTEQNAEATVYTASLSITPEGKGMFHISGRVQAKPLLTCSRCLKSFSYPIDAKMSFDLAPASFQGTSSEHELGKSELDIEFYQGEEIEPMELVKEQLLMSLPMVPLHNTDCKGLCTVCGEDLNIKECDCRKKEQHDFSAFSALQDLFKKQKE